MSLPLKLILVLLMALVFPLAVSQWHLLENFNQVQRLEQQEQLQKTVDATASLLSDMERDALFNARLMATSGELERYLKRSRYRLPEMVTYRALLKSWSVYLKHYAHYQQIAYVTLEGDTLVQFSLRPDQMPLALTDDSLFLAGSASRRAELTWYRPQADTNRLQLLVAYGVASGQAGAVVRSGSQTFSGYIVIRSDIDASLFRLGDNDEAPQALALHLDNLPVVSAGTRRVMSDKDRVQVERTLNPHLSIHGSTALQRIDWFDPVMVRSGLFSLLQFAVAALIFFLIVHRWLVQPLQHALALTRQLGDGHWLAPNPQPRRDEMGALIQALHNMSDHLQHTTGELDAKRAQAQQAERLKTEFLASISHEIRTPVNIIVGVMNRLIRVVSEPRQQEYLQAAINEAHKLVYQIDELILLADLETRKHPLQVEEFYIPDLVQRAVATFEPLAGQKQLVFAVSIDDALADIVSGDGRKIAKVLDVLLANAIKFSSQGQVALRVQLLDRQADHVLCEFAVEDTGCGIDPAAIPWLGQAFVQGDGSLVRAHGGLGLGLAIASGLLALMDSKLEISSTPGSGSLFRFVVRLGRSVRVPRT